MGDGPNYGIRQRGGTIRSRNLAVGPGARAGDVVAGQRSGADAGVETLREQVRQLAQAIEAHTAALQESSRLLETAAEQEAAQPGSARDRFSAIVDRLSGNLRSVAGLTAAVDAVREAIARLS
jgi:small-conductance mechanosensitive channel